MDEYLPTLKTEAKAKITEYAYDDARRNYALIKDRLRNLQLV